MRTFDEEIMTFENLGPQPRCGNTAVNPLFAHANHHEGLAVRPHIPEMTIDRSYQRREGVEKRLIFRDCIQVPPVFAGMVTHSTTFPTYADQPYESIYVRQLVHVLNCIENVFIIASVQSRWVFPDRTNHNPFYRDPFIHKLFLLLLSLSLLEVANLYRRRHPAYHRFSTQETL